MKSALWLTVVLWCCSSYYSIWWWWCYNLSRPHGGTRGYSYLELSYTLWLNKIGIIYIYIYTLCLLFVLFNDYLLAVTFHRALVMWVFTPWGTCTGSGPSVWASVRSMDPSTTQKASTPSSWRTTNWYQHSFCVLLSHSRQTVFLSDGISSSGNKHIYPPFSVCLCSNMAPLWASQEPNPMKGAFWKRSATSWSLLLEKSSSTVTMPPESRPRQIIILIYP